VHFLNGPDIAALNLSDDEILDAIEGQLAAQGRGQTVIHPRTHLEPGVANGHFNVLRGYIGAPVIERHLTGAALCKRVGLLGLERVPVREGTTIVDAQGHKLGTVTSGTLGPSVNQPVAMAYLPLNHTAPHSEVYAEVRGKRVPMRVVPMPFHPHNYFRG
jgi:hypothetical protein